MMMTLDRIMNYQMKNVVSVIQNFKSNKDFNKKVACLPSHLVGLTAHTLTPFLHITQANSELYLFHLLSVFDIHSTEHT